MGPRKFSKAWNEEFEVMRAMQDDRMMMHSNLTCHERCVSSYMANNFILTENTCMRNCLAMLQQTMIVTNLHMQKFEEQEQRKLATKGKGAR